MGLKHADLRRLVEPHFGIDMYEADSGSEDEVVVVSFSALTKDAAQDLASFVDKSVVPGLLDAKASPGPGEDGNYRVYIEFMRTTAMPVSLVALIKDVANVAPSAAWTFEVFGDSDRIYDATCEADVVDAFIGKDGGVRMPAPAKKLPPVDPDAVDDTQHALDPDAKPDDAEDDAGIDAGNDAEPETGAETPQ